MMVIRWRQSVLVIRVVALLGTWSAAAVDFAVDVAPLLHRHCLTCHDDRRQKGNYRMDVIGLLFEPGDSNTWPIVAGDPAGSYLWRLLVTSDPDDRMPQNADPLPPESLKIIRQWIEEGASLGGVRRDASLTSILPRPEYPSPPEVYPQPYPAQAIQFSPDGRFLLAGGVHELLVYSAATGEILHRVDGIAERTTRILATPDDRGYILCTGSPGRTGELIRIPPDFSTIIPLALTSDSFFGGCFPADGRHFACVEASGRIRLFKYPGFVDERSINAHADWGMVLVPAWDTDRERQVLFSGGRDRSIKAFDWEDGSLVMNMVGLPAAVTGLAVRPDGKTGSALLEGESRLSEWDIDKDRAGRGFDPQQASVQGRPAVLESYGKLALCGTTEGSVLMLSADHSRVEKALKSADSPVVAIAAHPDGSMLAVCHSDGVIRIISMDSGMVIRNVPNLPVAPPDGDRSR